MRSNFATKKFFLNFKTGALKLIFISTSCFMGLNRLEKLEVKNSNLQIFRKLKLNYFFLFYLVAYYLSSYHEKAINALYELA